MNELETYPGTDLVVRSCYGCQKHLEQLSDVWVDMAEYVCVCEDCKERAEREYPGECQHMPALEFLADEPEPELPDDNGN